MHTRDEEVRGVVIGGFYLNGAIYYDGRFQARLQVEQGPNDEVELRKAADDWLKNKKAENGKAFESIWPKNAWELRIYS